MRSQEKKKEWNKQKMNQPPQDEHSTTQDVCMPIHVSPDDVP